MKRIKPYLLLAVALLAPWLVTDCAKKLTGIDLIGKPPARGAYIIPPDGGGGGGGSPSGCLFPSNNLYFADVTGLSVNDSSGLWTATFRTSPKATSNSDTGYVHLNLSSTLGHYINHTGPADTSFHVTGPGTDAASYPANGGWTNYPYRVHKTFLQQGDPDQHCLMADTVHCLYYETYRTSYGTYADSNACYDGVKWDASTNDLHALDCSSADEAGLPIAAGLFTYKEVMQTNLIAHALRCQSYGANILAGSAGTAVGTIWPARHSSHSGGGYTIKSHAFPMGTRFRLSASYTPTGAAASDAGFLAMTACAKTYGLILGDRGSSEFALSGVADTRWGSWPSNFMTWSAQWIPYLEVVNEDGHKVSASSMQYQP